MDFIAKRFSVQICKVLMRTLPIPISIPGMFDSVSNGLKVQHKVKTLSSDSSVYNVNIKNSSTTPFILSLIAKAIRVKITSSFNI